MSRRRQQAPVIGWITITYRSVVILTACVCALILFAAYLSFPQQSHAALEAATGFFQNLADKWFPSSGANSGSDGAEQQANFTALEGTVRVKKHNQNTWSQAGFNLPLEKGDVVQTGADGMAKVVFADGTNYVVKQDSLIVIEENSMNMAQQTNVAVQVTTGTVDLATAAFTDGSSSKVIVAGATAKFNSETAAQVSNDPRGDHHEITVRKGSGSVSRNGETVQLSDFDRVSFQADAPRMTKVKETGPPTLITPANMTPVFTGGAAKPLQFTWSQAAGAAAYRVRISRNAFFSSVLYDRVVTATEVTMPPLAEGAYYWLVQSQDANGKESVESEKNRFTVIAKTAEHAEIPLELDPFIQHGHIIEVRGKTDPAARVMVNGEEVPLVSSDGTFRKFLRPLPAGENLVTVTAQDARGAVNTKQEHVLIQ
ncbi:MAG: hypothetical protein JO041_06965 [Acidobacteria bacterium]|nr:hypothetical protein [Acidobacteriota bacterium]